MLPKVWVFMLWLCMTQHCDIALKQKWLLRLGGCTEPSTRRPSSGQEWGRKLIPHAAICPENSLELCCSQSPTWARSFSSFSHLYSWIFSSPCASSSSPRPSTPLCRLVSSLLLLFTALGSTAVDPQPKSSLEGQEERKLGKLKLIV